MRHGSQLQSFELHEKLDWDTNYARDEKQHPRMSIAKSWRSFPKNRQEPKASEDETIAAVLEDVDFGKSDLAEEKSGTPQAARSSEARDCPHRIRLTMNLFRSLRFQVRNGNSSNHCVFSVAQVTTLRLPHSGLLARIRRSCKCRRRVRQFLITKLFPTLPKLRFTPFSISNALVGTGL